MRTFLLIFLLLGFFPGRSQDLTGTWEGVFSADSWSRNDQYFIRLELVQMDREVHGFLSIRNFKDDRKPQITYLLSGELPKKKGQTFRLYRESIGETDFSRERAEYFNDLLIDVKNPDSLQKKLGGYWFPNIGNGTFPNGAAGRWAVARTGNKVAAAELSVWIKAKEMEEKIGQ